MEFENCLLLNVKNLNRKINNIAEKEFKKINLHPTYAYIIFSVAKSKEIKTKDIASTLGLDSSTVTRMVDKLIENKYLIKGNENSKLNIILDKKGKDSLIDIQKCWENINQTFEEKLNEKNLKKLEKNLNYANERLN